MIKIDNETQIEIIIAFFNVLGFGVSDGIGKSDGIDVGIIIVGLIYSSTILFNSSLSIYILNILLNSDCSSISFINGFPSDFKQAVKLLIVIIFIRLL